MGFVVFLESPLCYFRESIALFLDWILYYALKGNCVIFRNGIVLFFEWEISYFKKELRVNLRKGIVLCLGRAQEWEYLCRNVKLKANVKHKRNSM